MEIGSTTKKKKRVKMLKPSQIINKSREYIILDGRIGESLGNIELGTKIFITGRSFSGKSSFITQLCKEFAKKGIKIDYNNHEEKGGDASTVKKKIELAGIDKDFDNKIRFYKAPLLCDEEQTFDEILSRKGSAGFVRITLFLFGKTGFCAKK